MVQHVKITPGHVARMKGGRGGQILSRDAEKGLNKIQHFYHKKHPRTPGFWSTTLGLATRRHLVACVPLNPPGNPKRGERHCTHLIEEVTETQSKVPRFTPLLSNRTKTWTMPGPTPTR